MTEKATPLTKQQRKEERERVERFNKEFIKKIAKSNSLKAILRNLSLDELRLIQDNVLTITDAFISEKEAEIEKTKMDQERSLAIVEQLKLEGVDMSILIKTMQDNQ